MQRWAQIYPEYGLEHNKGYGTPDHLDALRRHGVTPGHRLSFAPVAELADFSGELPPEAGPRQITLFEQEPA